jgi:NAD(P)-dependent dehydrogenase (short-subunit alcohol dehydrogenase family)
VGERQASVAPAPLDECIIANALTDWRFTLEHSASVYVYGGEHCAVSAPFSAPSTSTKLGLLAQNLCSAEAVVSKLTAVCVPLLRKSAAGRVVNVSSAAGQFSFLASDRLKMDPEKLYYAYPVSKTALNAATVLLASFEARRHQGERLLPRHGRHQGQPHARQKPRPKAPPSSSR